MKRTIEQDLLQWKNSEHRKPLVLRGARQVGKTYTINEFGKNHFNSFITLDFEKEPRLASIFSGDLLPVKIFERILIERNIEAEPEDTLLFFDEIQLCPRGLISLRYFFEEMPQLCIIAAGSLLEFSLNEASFPVGRVEFRWMFPMTFPEFLDAGGNDRLHEALPDISTVKPVDEFIHSKLLELLKVYFVVGGMPEAVSRYLQKGKLTAAVQVHKDLCSAYIEDFAKYNSRIDRFLLEKIFRNIPALTGSHLKYSHLAEGYRNEKIKTGFDVLTKSLIVYPVIATTGHLPLLRSSNEKIFKTVFLDIGLMHYLCGISVGDTLDTGNITGIFHGALAEQFIGQQLTASLSSEYPEVYFWNRLKKSSQAELDYLITRGNRPIPIEVKGGSSGSLKSLHLFFETFPDVEKGYVFSHRNIAEIKEQRIKFVPLYCRVR